MSLIEPIGAGSVRHRDLFLGRWRSSAHPDWVVYPRNRGAARVINEADGSMFAVKSGDIGHLNPSVLRDVIAEYRDQLPKPWHDAKPGEAWVLTVNGDEGAAVAWDTHAGVAAFIMDNLQSVSLDDEGITAGRRIWPTEEATK